MSLARLWRRSIWHPDSIPPEEWKYRWLKRVWLPIYDLFAIAAGFWAAAFGSPILYRLLGDGIAVDILGMMFAFVGTLCFLGIAFPSLYRIEIFGKILLIGMLGAYAAAIALFNANGDTTSWFVAFVVLMTLPLPFFRLNLLGEEIKERREGA